MKRNQVYLMTGGFQSALSALHAFSFSSLSQHVTLTRKIDAFCEEEEEEEEVQQQWQQRKIEEEEEEEDGESKGEEGEEEEDEN